MIKVTFKNRQGQLTGFSVKGHSGSAQAGNDIICASVSSAVYMTANTITDILQVPADINIDDGFMDFTLSKVSPPAQDIIKGLELHLCDLQQQYPKFIKISTEV